MSLAHREDARASDATVLRARVSALDRSITRSHTRALFVSTINSLLLLLRSRLPKLFRRPSTSLSSELSALSRYTLQTGYDVGKPAALPAKCLAVNIDHDLNLNQQVQNVKTKPHTVYDQPIGVSYTNGVLYACAKILNAETINMIYYLHYYYYYINSSIIFIIILFVFLLSVL